VKLYTELAPWYHLWTQPRDYAVEARRYAEIIKSRVRGPARRVMELGSGGGNNASHLKAHFEMTLTDLSPQMLEQSKRLNPECRHIQGDMRTLALDEEFDAVFVHDAVSYLTREQELKQMFETAVRHCRPGGLVMVVPDFFRESFVQQTRAGGHDDNGRSLRYLEWTYDPDPQDTEVTTQYAVLLREKANGPTEFVHLEHHYGLFPLQTWLATMAGAGLVEVERVEIGLTEPEGYSALVGLRPGAPAA